LRSVISGDHLNLRPAYLDANKNRLHETNHFIARAAGKVERGILALPFRAG